MKTIKINIPKNVELILNILKNNGYEGYIVGGCIRDSLLGIEPKDWDITTNAKPNEILNIFKDFRIIPTGLKHGTVTIVINNIGYEVTTYRVDGEYEDSRHPKQVNFVDTLKEDLSRRDFTINAMAYNYDNGLIDYYGGVYDLNNKIINTVGEANKRFEEDALRMLRAIRFSAKYNFEMSKEVKEGIITNGCLLDNISKERIREEFNKIIMYNPSKIKDIINFYISRFICSEFRIMYKYNQNNPYHSLDLLEHSINATKIVDTLNLKLVMIFHDIGKIYKRMIDEKLISHYHGHAEKSYELSLGILKNLRYANEDINYISTLIRIHDFIFAEDEKNIRKQLKKLLNKYGENIVKDLLKVRIADISSQNPVYLLKRLNKVYKVNEILQDILNSKQCFIIKDLNISGKDIMNLMNITKGNKNVGIVLNNLLEYVIEDNSLNTKDKLIKLAKHEIDNLV